MTTHMQSLSLTPQQTTEALVENGVARHTQSVDRLFLKAVWGGIFLSYGGLLESVIGGSPSAMTNNPGLLRLVEGLVFPVGLTLIVLTGTELLTSDMMIIPLAASSGKVPWWGVPYNYFVVFWGNLAGSLFFAAILTRYTHLATGPVATFITNAGSTRGALAWYEVFLRGIGCNIMVCMSVYVATSASDILSKIVGIYVVLSAFVVIQFEHVIADMFTLPMSMMLGGSPSIGRYIGTDLLGALVGNIVGAWLLAVSLWWFYLYKPKSVREAKAHEKDPEAARHGSEETVGGPGGHGSNPYGGGTHFA